MRTKPWTNVLSCRDLASFVCLAQGQTSYHPSEIGEAPAAWAHKCRSTG